jgi:hypothetical protein
MDGYKPNPPGNLQDFCKEHLQIAQKNHSQITIISYHSHPPFPSLALILLSGPIDFYLSSCSLSHSLSLHVPTLLPRQSLSWSSISNFLHLPPSEAAGSPDTTFSPTPESINSNWFWTPHGFLTICSPEL